METIAVVGCGRTASELVEAAGRAGFTIKVIEADASDPGSVFEGLLYAVIDGRLSPLHRDLILARVELTEDLGALAECGLVIDCVEAPVPRKIELLRRLEQRMTGGSILATQDPAVHHLAEGMDRPAQFLAMYFHDAETGVEIEATHHTGLGVLDGAVRFCEAIERPARVLPEAAE